MTPEDKKFERIAQRHIAALKKSSKAITEDAAVRALHKIMAEFEDKSEESLMETPPEFIDALKYDVARRDSEAHQAYEDAFVNGTGVMLNGKRIDPASIYKEPEQNPVAWMDSNDDVFFTEEDAHKTGIAPIRPLYTSHTQRRKTWAGLTDKELRELEKQFNAERVRSSDEEYLIIYPSAYWAWMKAIEAKLKEKNYANGNS